MMKILTFYLPPYSPPTVITFIPITIRRSCMLLEASFISEAIVIPDLPLSHSAHPPFFLNLEI